MRVKNVVSPCDCFLDAVRVRIRSSVRVGMNGIMWPLGPCSGGVLWLVGFQKRVEDVVGGDSRVIV